MSRTLKDSTKRETSASGITSGSFSVAAGALVEVHYGHRASGARTLGIDGTGAFAGLTWEQVSAQNSITGSNFIRAGIFTAQCPAGGTGTITVTADASTTRAAVLCFEETGQNTTDATRQSKAAAGSAATLSLELNSAPLTPNKVVVLGLAFAGDNSASGADIQPGDSGGFAEDGEIETNTGTNDIILQSQVRGSSTDQTCDLKNLPTTGNLIIALEIEAAGGTAPDAPTAPTIAVQGATSVQLGWTDNADDETGFEVEVAPDSLLTGSIAVTNGLATVVGTGTAFVTESPAGTRFRVEGDTATYEVLSVADDANLTLTTTVARATASGLDASKPGTFAAAPGSPAAANAVTHSITGRTQTSVYWARVRAANTSGNSAYTSALHATTRALPTITLEMPTGEVPVPPGLDITFQALASDADGALSSVSFDSDIDGPLGDAFLFAGSTWMLSAPLATPGAHIITATATDADSDTATDTVNLTVESAAKIRRRLEMLPIIYGSVEPIDVLLLDPVTGLPVQPTLVAGDAKLYIDDALIGNITLVAETGGGFSWTPSSASQTSGKRIQVVAVDQTSPAEWIANPWLLRTYGHPSAYYPQPLIAVDSTGAVTVGSLAAVAIQSIWDALTSALTTVGSIGKLLVDNINAAISSRLASASYTAPPTAAAIATEVFTQADSIEPNVNLRGATQLILAASTGLSAGVAAGTPAFRGVQPDGAGLLNPAAPVRVTGTADAGDRTAITVTTD